MAENCIEMVYHAEGNWGRSYQCQRKDGHGPDGKYCHQHAEKYTQGNTTTWYRADCYSEWSMGICEVEVLKETNTSLLIKTPTKAERQAKTSTYYRYFATREEAVTFYQKRIAGLRKRADDLEKNLESEIKK